MGLRSLDSSAEPADLDNVHRRGRLGSFPIRRGLRQPPCRARRDPDSLALWENDRPLLGKEEVRSLHRLPPEIQTEPSARRPSPSPRPSGRQGLRDDQLAARQLLPTLQNPRNLMDSAASILHLHQAEHSPPFLLRALIIGGKNNGGRCPGGDGVGPGAGELGHDHVAGNLTGAPLRRVEDRRADQQHDPDNGHHGEDFHQAEGSTKSGQDAGRIF